MSKKTNLTRATEVVSPLLCNERYVTVRQMLWKRFQHARLIRDVFRRFEAQIWPESLQKIILTDAMDLFIEDKLPELIQLFEKLNNERLEIKYGRTDQE